MEGGVRDILRVYWRHVRRYRALVCLVLFGSALASLAEVIAPTYYKQFFDQLSSATPALEQLQPLVNTLLVIMSVHIGGWILWRITGVASDIVQPRLMADLEDTAFSHLIGHSYNFFSNAFAGSLIRKVNRLPRAFDTFADTIKNRLIPLAVTAVGIMVVLWGRSPLLTVVLVIWTMLFLTVNYGVSKWKLKYDILRAQRDTEANGVLSDAISNSVTIKLFSGQKHEERLFRGAIDLLRDIRIFSAHLLEASNAIQAALMILIEFIVTYVALRYWVAGTLSLGDFALIQGFLITLFNKLWDFGHTIREIYESFADAKEMVEIMETPHAIQDYKSAKPLQVTKGKIEFREVEFSYSRTRQILDNFNLLIKPRERVALVGPSGAGKSTVVKLLLRFHDIDGGKILIDDQLVWRVTQESLRDAISLVPQEPILFHRSLMENIRYGRRDATDEEVIAAAEQARCHDFIMDMPNGYDTYVGERGVKLSGGERQRVAIARAILKNAPILILDEATSSLDSESEALIQAALEELMHDKTTIVIAHRLSTIMQMDRIVVIENGRVSATGTHQALLRKGGTYKTLWNIQAGGFIP